MSDWIRSWGQRTEFLVVCALAFGYFILLSLAHVLFHPGRVIQPSSGSILFTALIEVVVLVAVGSVLYVRGRTFGELHFHPSWRLTGIGLLLVAVTIPIYGFSAALVIALHPVSAEHLASMHFGDLSISAIAGFSVVNSFYEEALLLGYVAGTVEKNANARIAVVLSAGLRAAYHAYQGSAGLFGVFVLGLVFGYSFLKLRQLWPAIFAHGLFDFVGLVLRR